MNEKFIYKTGIINEVLKENNSLGSFSREDSQIELYRIGKESGTIFQPLVIGVYQHREPTYKGVPLNGPPNNLEEDYKKFMEAYTENVDSIHPNLICILYNDLIDGPKHDENLIRRHVSDPLERIKVSPLSNIPDFSKKGDLQARISGIFKEVEDLIITTRDQVENTLQDIRASRQDYGLTRFEAAKEFPLDNLLTESKEYLIAIRLE